MYSGLTLLSTIFQSYHDGTAELKIDIKHEEIYKKYVTLCIFDNFQHLASIEQN